MKDSSPVLTNSQVEALSKQTITTQTEIKEEPDPELVIPKTSVPNYQNNGKQNVNSASKSPENRKSCKTNKGNENHLIRSSLYSLLSNTLSKFIVYK